MSFTITMHVSGRFIGSYAVFTNKANSNLKLAFSRLESLAQTLSVGKQLGVFSYVHTRRGAGLLLPDTSAV